MITLGVDLDYKMFGVHTLLLEVAILSRKLYLAKSILVLGRLLWPISIYIWLRFKSLWFDFVCLCGFWCQDNPALFTIITVHHCYLLSLCLSFLHSILCPGSILPLLCSEHHSSVLWLDYHSSTSLHSCGKTISLLSSRSYDLFF